MSVEPMKKPFFLTAFFILVLLILLEPVINIMINPGAQNRYEITNKVLYFGIYPFLLFGLLSCISIPAIPKVSFFAFALSATFYIPLYFSSYFSNMPITKGALPSRYLELYLGFALSILCATKNYDIRKAAISILIIGTFFAVVFAYYLMKNDLLDFWQSPVYDVNRPQVRGNLLHSTEMSNVLAAMFILGVAIIHTYKSHMFVSVLIFTICILLLTGCFLLGSLGAFLGIGAVLLLHLSYNLKKLCKVLPFFILFLISIYFCLPQSTIESLEAFRKKAQNKVQNDGRAQQYAWMVDRVASFRLLGEGLGSVYQKYGQHPHQNVLGLWVEGGIITTCAYLFMVFISLYGIYFLMIRNIIHIDNTSLLFLMYSATGTAIFLHIKGIFQDTAYSHLTFLSTGIIYGIVSVLKGKHNIFNQHISFKRHLSEPI
jgi:O-antigen ligase